MFAIDVSLTDRDPIVVSERLFQSTTVQLLYALIVYESYNTTRHKLCFSVLSTLDCCSTTVFVYDFVRVRLFSCATLLVSNWLVHGFSV